MSNLFGNLTNEGLEESQDRLGGYQPFDSDAYVGKIKAAYAGKSDSGALNVSLIVDVDGREYRETIYVTNRKGQNFFLNKQDNTKKVPLPGFTIIEDICLITTGAPLSEQGTEEKVINLYDRDLGREAPKAVQMLTGLLGKEVGLGILRILENKSEKKGDEYVATAAERTVNAIDKVFHPELRFTVAEARAGKETPEFMDKWVERNKGQVIDKRQIKDGQAGVPAGGPPKAGAAPAGERKSLFPSKK